MGTTKESATVWMDGFFPRRSAGESADRDWSRNKHMGHVMKTAVVFGSALLIVGLLVGCDRAKVMSRGFVFPVGDETRGRQAYIALECYTCHRVDGVPDLPGPAVSADRVVILGGKMAKVRSYGDLVTAIIHPNYEISEKLVNRAAYAESPMRVVNDKMTVTQMLDIVTFLQPRYRELEPINYDLGM